MIKKLNNLSFTFSPRAFLSVVPTVVPFGIVEFLIFRISPSKTDCLCLPVVLSTKEEIYINFRVLLTKVKLFNSFLCKTTYSLLLKEQTTIILKYFHFSSEKTFNF
jgi:hypothetical protein